MKKNIFIIFLFLIFLLMSGYKIISILKNPHFNMIDDTALYWTESALQYRNAKQIAESGFLLSPDRFSQYPEGLDVKNRLTILMEVISGYIYRIFIPDTVPFHLFLVIFISLYSSLSIFPLYLLSRYIFKDRIISIIPVLFYATAIISYRTVIGINYELQDFALPFLFFNIYFLIRALHEKSIYYALLAGISLIIGFATWHLTQFYFILFLIYAVVDFIFNKDFDIKVFLIVFSSAFLAGVAIPTLRSGGFLMSAPMLICYAILFTYFIIIKYFRIKTNFVLLVVVIIFIIMGRLLYPTHIQEYSHVWNLVWAKITHLGARPAHPGDLPWETLCMWVSPFVSPSINDFWISFGTLFIFGIPGMISEMVNFVKNKYDKPIILYFTLIFLFLYLFFIRMGAFFVFFLSLQTAKLMKKGNKFIIFVLPIGLFINVYLLINFNPKFAGPDKNYLMDIIYYIRNYTPKDKAVLTTFAYGPAILAYTGRPILLHSKFEERFIREKIKEFEHILFKTEMDFYEYCKKYDAEYFIYQTDILLALGPKSIRYRTHNLRVPKDCIAYKFHFRPEELKFFKLIHSNPHYRIYQVSSSAENLPMGSEGYFRVYDERQFDLRKYGIYD